MADVTTHNKYIVHVGPCSIEILYATCTGTSSTFTSSLKNPLFAFPLKAGGTGTGVESSGFLTWTRSGQVFTFVMTNATNMKTLIFMFGRG